ncbi:MAG: 4-hydroxy-tetrahydrodipicolinate synthase [Pseudomonadota bacterium]
MFKGSLPALITPFRNGLVDEAALKDLVEWHIAEGSHGLVPVGTTGESPTLTHQEHERVIAVVVEAVAGRIPVIAGAGSNNTVEAVRFVKFAKTVGADGALVVTPYYNKPTQAGLIAHYEALSDAADIPIVIYNIPGRSIIDMTPATMGHLAKRANIVGVKDATGDVVRVSQQRASCGTDFIQLSGEDASALGFNVHGGVGCISVTANVAPKLCAEFQNATLAGDWSRALELQDQLMDLHTAVFREPGVVGAKAALAMMGKCSDEVRLPITGASADTKAALKAAMAKVGITV